MSILPNSLYHAARFASYLEEVLGFSVPSIILKGLLKRHVYLNECVIRFGLACFCVSRFVACDRPVWSCNKSLKFRIPYPIRCP